MRKKSLLLLLLMAMFAPWAAQAQEELTVYDGTNNNSYVPFYGLYADTQGAASECVIPSDQLEDMTGGQITAMKFYITTAAGAAWTGTHQVYLGEVDATTLTGITGPSAFTVVKTASFDATRTELIIEFDEPYTYGGGNLLIGTYVSVAGNYKSAYFAGVNQTATTAWYRNSATASGSAVQFLPKTTFTYTAGSGVTCEKPETLEATNVTENGAALTWTGGSGKYNIELNGTVIEENYAGYTYNLANLTPATTYAVRVQSVCDDATSSWKSVSFTTACGVITTFPWTETFERYASGNFSDPCWVNEHISGSGTSVFQISTSSNAGNSTHQLQLPDMAIGTLTKLVLPEMNVPANYEFSIDIYRSSSTYNDNYPNEGIRVYASIDGEIEGATELAFIPRHYQVSNDVIPAEGATGWYTYELPIGMSGTCYIILRGESQYCASTFMDNLAVKEIPTCLKPTGLAVTANSITAHSATITWTSDADAWQICLNNDEENLIDVTETTYTFTGLTSETSYSVKVRTNCDGDYSEFTLPVSFTTAIACPAPTGLTCNALTSNSATLSWTETGTATSWDIHYSTDATFNTYSSAQADDTPTVTLNNLTPETVYYARVQAYCGGEDGVSAFSTTVSFEPTAKIVIGSGTLTTSYLPSNTNYNYSYTQQIYTTEELGEAGVIESIDFYMTSPTNYTRNLDVYMVSTTKNAFENTSDWISVNSSDLVFRGEVNFAAQAWTTITLSEGFVYDGTQNVAIIIDDNTGVYSSRYFRSFNGQSNQSIYKYQDGSNIDPSQAPAGTCTSSKNQIRILKDEMPDCIKPTNLTATEVAPDYAVLSWSQYGEVAAWNVEVTDVAQATTTTWTANAIPFTLVGLSNETEYSVKVSPDCDQTLWSDAITFTTLEGCPAPENLAVNGIAHYTATATWTGYATSYEVTLGWNGEPNTLLSVDFAGGIPTDWTNGSTYPWELVDGYIKTTNAGVSSSTSSISFTKTYPANGTIEFDAECMGEGSSSFYDHCDFYIDDERMLYAGANISGWKHYSFQVTAGEHTFTWSYTKDSSVNPTGDYFAIDNVVLQTSDIVWGDPITTTDTEFTFEGLNANTDYYVKVQSFCPAEGAISEVSFTTLSEDYKLFVTEGEWKEGSNWSPIGVPTIEQDVELRANATITEVAEAKSITQGNYTITIEDGGQLIHNSTGVTATVKKTIAPWTAKGGYYFISNPLTSYITPSEENGLLSGNYDLYDWNAIAGDGNEWRNYRAQTFTLSYGLYGYLYANEVGADLSFTGTIRSSQNNQSRYVYAYTSTDYDFGTWSLLGNPFVCNAYLVNAYTNGTALPFYKMNADGDGYDAVIGEPIAPMEGIFYAAEDAGSVYMSRTAPAPASDGKLNMNLRSANKQLDNAILVFGGNQRLGKMSFRANSSKIYMPVEGKDYAITNAEGNMGEMPVSFKAENNGTYSLSFNAEEVSFAYLHLIDNMTGNDVNLLETPSYSFEANTTDYANRFRLVFATGNNGDDDTFAFFSNGSFVINNEGNATVQVIDVNGRILSSENINGCANLNVKAAAGVYMIRLVNGDNVKVQKVVVK